MSAFEYVLFWMVALAGAAIAFGMLRGAWLLASLL